ncbi:hypothetical protein [Pseudomonas sp. EL_65y_Pfl1_R32]|uniref:hypothetical protein n=1 Tax=Pseudomonas sp. EL_65y_Pfl1_R32 TaxID=3088696 RepID=UPI0030D77798
MTIRNDHFFGKLRLEDATSYPTMSLVDLIELGKISGPKHFTAQLRRLLATSTELVVNDTRSQPSFYELLDCMDLEEVGIVYLNSRHAPHSALVPGTIECGLGLVEGVIRVCPTWTAYNSAHAEELAKSLLLPLNSRKLTGRTIVGASREKLFCAGESQIEQVFKLVKSPYYSGTHGKIQKYVDLASKA